MDAPEIKAILGDGDDKLAALSGAVSSGPGAGDEEMNDVSSATPAPAATAVNLTALGSSTAPVEAEVPVDFTPLAGLVRSLYVGNYQAFFLALAAVEENFFSQDRYLFEHKGWFVREMRLRGYQQLLQSYRVVGLGSMAKDFGISVEFLDRYEGYLLFLLHGSLTPSALWLISGLPTPATWPNSSPPTEFLVLSIASTASSKLIGPTTKISNIRTSSNKAMA